MEAAKNIFCPKDGGLIDLNTINRSFKIFCLGCQNLSNRRRCDRPKTINSDTVFPAIEHICQVALKKY